MKKDQSVKGAIPVAMAFIIVLSLILIATTGIFWSKTSLSVSRLKRYQAINYAKAALREAARRFWGDYNDAGTIWNIETWAAVPPNPPPHPFVTIDGVQVDIDVIVDNMGTPADTTDDRFRISATVDYGDIRL